MTEQDKPDTEKTVEELQRELLITQKKMLDLQQQQTARQEEHHQENRKTAWGVIVAVVIVAVLVLGGVLVYRSVNEYTLDAKKSKYDLCMTISGDSEECAAEAGLTHAEMEQLGLAE